MDRKSRHLLDDGSSVLRTGLNPVGSWIVGHTAHHPHEDAGKRDIRENTWTAEHSLALPGIRYEPYPPSFFWFT